jgi:hypothetical protein
MGLDFHVVQAISGDYLAVDMPDIEKSRGRMFCHGTNSCLSGSDGFVTFAGFACQ